MTQRKEVIDLLESITIIPAYADEVITKVLALLRTEQPEPRAYDFAINCGAMGKGDDSCCGCIIWTTDGKLLCNECGTEYHLVEKAPEQPPPGEFTKKVRSNVQNWKSVISKITDCRILSIIGWIPQLCDRLDRAEVSKADLLAVLEQIAVLNAGKDNDIQWLCNQAREKEGK